MATSNDYALQALNYAAANKSSDFGVVLAILALTSAIKETSDRGYGAGPR